MIYGPPRRAGRRSSILSDFLLWGAVTRRSASIQSGTRCSSGPWAKSWRWRDLTMPAIGLLPCRSRGGGANTWLCRRAVGTL